MICFFCHARPDAVICYKYPARDLCRGVPYIAASHEVCCDERPGGSSMDLFGSGACEDCTSLVRQQQYYNSLQQDTATAQQLESGLLKYCFSP